MNVAVDEREIQLVLATLGLAAFVTLLLARYRLHRRWHQRDMSRLLLIDSLLVIAGLELVADALTELHAPGDPWHQAFTAIAFACRGALVAGGIALAATLEWRRAT
jgi:hypothetical protein